MMRQLSRTENVVLIIGAVLMVAGSAGYVLSSVASPYIYSAGALAFAAMQMRQRYDGGNVTVRRLRRIVLVSDLLFLLTGVMMFANRSYDFMGLDILTWLRYVHNNWVVTLLIAAILQLYTVYRIGNELEKDTKKM